MSKGISDGDVLSNRLSLGLAKRQKLLASLMGSPEDDPATSETLENGKEDAELEESSFGHDRLGVGGILPKDVANGTLTKRNITNDKLLEQLIGKKRAKAHLASKEQAERAGPQQASKTGRRAVAKKEESDDEEEGRAATFKSKRRKVFQPKKALSSDDEASETGAITPAVDKSTEEDREQEAELKVSKEDGGDSDATPAKAKSKPLPSRSRPKATSYLDEILAERSKKKKNKSKNKSSADA